MTLPERRTFWACFAGWVPDPVSRDRVLVDNAHRLYGFGGVIE